MFRDFNEAGVKSDFNSIFRHAMFRIGYFCYEKRDMPVLFLRAVMDRDQDNELFYVLR